MKVEKHNTSNAYNQVLNSNIEAVRAITALLRSTIGPKGLDLMLVDEFGNSIITNDGYEILNNVQINHPAAKFALEACRSQETAIGDGTTTTAILLDALLESSSSLIEDKSKINQVIKGINKAAKKTIEALRKQKIELPSANDKKLEDIVTISARGEDDLSSLVVKTARKNAHLIGDKFSDFDLSKNVFSKTNVEERIIEGFLIKKKSHFDFNQNIKSSKVLLIEGPFEPDPISSESASTNEGVKKIETNIQSLLETAKRIAKAGVRAILTSSSMLVAAEEFFAKEGILVLTHVKKSDLNMLKTLARTKLHSRNLLFNCDIKSIEDISGNLKSISLDKEIGAFVFNAENENYKTYSMLISSATETKTEERKRIAIDACRSLSAALKNGYVMGEGVAEMNCVDELKAMLDASDEATGLEIFLDAIQAPFKQIIENAGMEDQKLIKFSIENKNGYNLDNGDLINLEDNGIIDALDLKISAIEIATAVATQILRINNIIQSK